ncbi:MAG: RNA polymerase sigma factor [Anaerostipes hadrus]
MQTEQKLIKRIKKKQDKEAANTLISYYYKEIYAYVYRQTGNEELAKDLTQDIFIQILQKIAMFDHKKLHFEHGCIGSHRIRYVIIIEARYIVCH